MGNEKMINTEIKSVLIDSVRFVRLENADEQIQLSVVINDSWYVKKISGDKLFIEYIRDVSLDPKYIFQVTVEQEILCQLGKGFEKVLDNDEKINDFAKRNAEKIINSSTACSFASSLIACLSSANKLVPVITPPLFVNKKEK